MLSSFKSKQAKITIKVLEIHIKMVMIHDFVFNKIQKCYQIPIFSIKIRNVLREYCTIFNTIQWFNEFKIHFLPLNFLVNSSFLKNCIKMRDFFMHNI